MRQPPCCNSPNLLLWKSILLQALRTAGTTGTNCFLAKRIPGRVHSQALFVVKELNAAESTEGKFFYCWLEQSFTCGCCPTLLQFCRWIYRKLNADRHNGLLLGWHEICRLDKDERYPEDFHPASDVFIKWTRLDIIRTHRTQPWYADGDCTQGKSKGAPFLWWSHRWCVGPRSIKFFVLRCIVLMVHMSITKAGQALKDLCCLYTFPFRGSTLKLHHIFFHKMSFESN